MHSCETGVTGVGPKDAKVILIGIAPGRTEWNKTREPFTGPAGKLLDGTLKAVGFSRDKCFLTNLICWWEDEPSADDIAACHSRLYSEIEQIKPNLIVLLGGLASREFLGRFKRGHLYWQDGRWYLPTTHPAAFLHDKDFKLDIADFARDIGKIPMVSEWTSGPKEPVIHIADRPDILWEISGLTAIDVETSYDYKPYAYELESLLGTPDSKLLCLSVANEQGVWAIPGPVISSAKPGWGSRPEVQWIMHNGLFDMAQLRRLAGERLRLKEDTLLMSYSLDERGGGDIEDTRSVGVHGLKDLASEFLGAPQYKVKPLEVEASKLHHYNALDAYYTYELYKQFEPRQREDDVRDMYERILIPGANALSEIQARGVKVDTKVLTELGAKFCTRWLELYEEINRESIRLGWDGEVELNLNSWKQLQHFLFDILKCRKHPIYGKSTRREVLEWLAETVPWCAMVVEWRSYEHILSTYVTGVEDDIKYDGKVHPEPTLHGTRSGRLGYHRPPIATIPKHGVDPELAAVRKMFIASDDKHEICEADLKQAELYATAYLSGDKAMLEALRSGDAHGATAREIFKTDENSPDWKAARELGKLFNFGTLYNRTAKGYVKNPFQGRKPPPELANFKFTMKTAQAFIDSWYAKYSRIKEWQKEQIKEAFANGEQITQTGRKRRYWLPSFKTVNQSVNIGPQSLAHDYLFNSLIKLHYALPEYDSYVLFEVHDSIIFEISKQWKEQAIDLIRRIMTEPKFNLPGIPVDIKTGPSWGEVA